MRVGSGVQVLLRRLRCSVSALTFIIGSPVPPAWTCKRVPTWSTVTLEEGYMGFHISLGDGGFRLAASYLNLVAWSKLATYGLDF